MSREAIDAADHKMARAVEVMERDFQGIRTGRASTGLVERIHIDYYGTQTPLNQLAGISIPEPHQIVIQPWDRSALSAIERAGIPTRVMSAIAMNEIAEPYIRRRAVRHLEKGRVVIFVAGTGNPYFTTDTAAALRAVEIGAKVLLKATKVDGVYDADPMTVPGARRFERLEYADLLRDQLKVLDGAAVSLCMENDLPIVVFDLNGPDNIARVAFGERVGTLIAGPTATAGAPA